MRLADLKPGDRFLETRLSDPSIEYTVVEGPRLDFNDGVTLWAVESRLLCGKQPNSANSSDAPRRVTFYDGDKSGCYGPSVHLIERGECDR